MSTSQQDFKRKDSSSTQSVRSTSPPASRSEGFIKRRSSDNKGQGTFMQCGRHSNSWLFNDISFKETAKGIFSRKDSS
ncbi:hypothetical protein Q7P37_009268 [Cladosporium fusiforme]